MSEKAITEEQLEEWFREWLDDGSLLKYEIEEIVESEEMEHSEIVVFMEEHDISHPEKRLEWFNQSGALSFDNVVRLCNVKFWVDECAHCKEKLWDGEPKDWAHFQGVWDNPGVPVDGSLNGVVVNVRLCEDCYHKISVVLGI